MYILPNSIHDKTEIILCDFSLKKNDSIFLETLNYEPLGYYKVDSVKEIITLVGQRKAIYLSSEWEQPVWIEGIGSLGGIEYSYATPEAFNTGELSCFFKNGEKIYEAEYVQNYGSCFIQETRNIDNFYINEIQFSPNPARYEIHINLENEKKFKVCIFNLNGKLMFQKENQNVINIGFLENGTYLIWIITGKQIMTDKLFIHKPN